MHRKPKLAVQKSYVSYSSTMASAGHLSLQEPHAIHASLSITNLPPTSEMASIGQSETQQPHIMHSSVILNI